MRILVTNDDGPECEGVHVLARELQDCGDVVVVVPHEERTGAGASVGTIHALIPEVRPLAVAGVKEAWTVNGPPGLCVMLASLGALGPPIDLVVVGINPGANVGSLICHSGTVGAALTARQSGINAVAVSQAVTKFPEGAGWENMLAEQCWDSAAAVAKAVVIGLLANLPADPLLVNLNVPNVPLEQIKTWRYTDIAKQSWSQTIGAVSRQPLGEEQHGFGLRMSFGERHSLPPETDAGAVERGEVSVTLLGEMWVASNQSGPVVIDTAMNTVFANH